VFPGAQQQPAVRPRRVRTRASPTGDLTLRALADIGQHLVPQHHQMEVIHHCPRAGQRPADP
jgi:hypothetical protein